MVSSLESIWGIATARLCGAPKDFHKPGGSNESRPNRERVKSDRRPQFRTLRKRWTSTVCSELSDVLLANVPDLASTEGSSYHGRAKPPSCPSVISASWYSTGEPFADTWLVSSCGKWSRIRSLIRTSLCFLLSTAVSLPGIVLAEVEGVAPGIPEPGQRNAIVQTFNWTFNDIKKQIPNLSTLGYSHIHVSPPQKSNEKVWQWWGRYQPVDYGTISGPLGSEAEFKEMNDVANANAMQIIVDAVLNHTVDVSTQPDPPFIKFDGDTVSEVTFPQFEPKHFHKRCRASAPNTEQACWLSYNLADLKTEDDHVRQVAKDYLQKLDSLGVDGYRFDAAIHIEPGFYSEVLSAVPGKFAFGEIIKDQPSHFKDWIAIPEMAFYDFPLNKTMREAFAFGGDLRSLIDPKDHDRALAGPKTVTFVRNHDIDRGQANDRGIDDPNGRQKFGVGWDEGSKTLNRTDVHLAYAYLFGREDGLPYVFVDMSTLSPEQQDDRYDDPFVVAGIRFHNLCLADAGGVKRREEIWRIERPNTIGWQRGNDRFIIINKATDWYDIRDLGTSLLQGEYKEVRTGWPLKVQSGGTIKRWHVPPRSAMMFIRIGD